MENWLLGIILALCTVIILILAVYRRHKYDLQVNVWKVLDDKSSTKFTAGSPNKFPHPALSGIYRHHLTSIGEFHSYDSDSWQNTLADNTLISLSVDNHNHSLFVLKPKSVITRVFTATVDPSGTPKFEKINKIRGNPPQLLHLAMKMI